MGKFIEVNPTSVKCKKRVLSKSTRDKEINKKSNTIENKHVVVPVKGVKRENNSNHSDFIIKKLKTTYEEGVRSTLFKRVESERPQDNFRNTVVTSFQLKDSDDFLLKLDENDESDLFFADEVKCSYEYIVNKDVLYHILDEISLEGLDGITIEAFWKRLSRGIGHNIDLNERIKEVIWRRVCNNSHVQFYVQENPRGSLQIFDRYKYIDADKGVIVDVPVDISEIYPYSLVKDPQLKGSCSTFKNRTDESTIVRQLSLQDAVKIYGMMLVVVADQKCRHKAIYNDYTDPNIELQNIEYCILEKIARSRELGELTQGKLSLSTVFDLDCKTIFYYKKQLVANQLIGKQFFYIKSSTSEQNKTGHLLHLRRFFHKVKPKQLIIAEQIVKVLKNKRGYRMGTSELKGMYASNKQSILKVLKMPEFHKFVTTDNICSYRDIYPNSSPSEYMCKGKNKEKCVKVLQLKDPFVNVVACWGNNNDEDSSDDEADIEDNQDGIKSVNVEFFKEVYQFVLTKGNKGVILQEIQTHFDMDIYTVRSALRKLQNRNVIDFIRVDAGKQRSFKYFARCLYDKETVIKLTPEPLPRNNQVLEKILMKQKEAIKDGSVYTKEQYDLEEQENTAAAMNLFPNVFHLEFRLFSCIYYRRDADVFKTNIIPVEVRAKFVDENAKQLINLLYRKFNCWKISGIRNIVKQQSVSSIIDGIASNFSTAYVAKRKDDYVMKLLLLRAMFKEIVINDDSTINFLTGSSKAVKRKMTVKETCDAQVKKSTSDAQMKKKNGLDFMGPNPLLISENVEEKIKTEIIVSTPPANFILNATKYQTTNNVVTQRILSRINTVIDVLNEQKIIDESSKLLKIIEDKEQKEGASEKIDRRSLQRIYTKLVEEGYIKFFKIIMSNDVITKTQLFICHPSVEHTHSMINSTCQQIKLKNFIGSQIKSVKRVRKTVEVLPSTQKSPFRSSDVIESLAEMERMKTTDELKSKYDKNVGKAYGFRPKFFRMRVMHEFLQYIIYNYPQNSRVISKEEVARLFQENDINMSESDLNEMPPIYLKEISWKMFIPPLPFHEGWPAGWALVCDILLRLPLSVFLELHNVTYSMSELKEYLAHPIKRFYLVKHTPSAVRTPLLYKRRYLAQMSETFNKLAYIGLLQFGPEKYKEKDQVFIYLNRRASLLDTTSSEPAYHKTTDKEYPLMPFIFNSASDVENYWFNLYTISMNTRLNARNIMAGKTITIVDVSANTGLMQAVKPRTIKEAMQLDNGDIPGDKRGAAGVDSSLWVHITRNWIWGAGTQKYVKQAFVNVKMDSITPLLLPYNEIRSATSKNKVYLHENKEVVEKVERKTMDPPTKTSKRVQKITRKLKPRRANKVRLVYCDHVDKALRKKLGKTKVKWDEHEDKLLLLSKSVSMFLCPRNIKKQSIPYYVVRDVLHRVYPKSRNKTSQAVRRRILWLYANDSAPKFIERNFHQLFKIDAIHKYFSNLIYKLTTEPVAGERPFKMTECEMVSAFVFLMTYVAEHSNEIEMLLLGKLTNYDYISDANIKNLDLVATDAKPERYQDASTEPDVRTDVIKSVIHSSLGNNSEYPCWAFQLFRVYQKFPDSLIRSAVADMKCQQIVSIKKNFVAKKNKNKNHFHTPFQLSNLYVYSLATTFTEVTAFEAYKTFRNLIDQNGRVSLDFSQTTIEGKKYGQMLAFSEISSFWNKTSFIFNIPDMAVILNPNINDHSDLVQELATRWQLKMKKQMESSEEPSNKIDSNYLNNACVEMCVLPGTSSNTRDSPLDLSMDGGGAETIDRLKIWVTDCMTSDRERRSPSPEFLGQSHDDTFNSAKNDSDDDVVDAMEETDNVESSVIINRIPTLEQIKEGMMRPTNPPETERKIPYITDLYGRLEFNADDEKLEKLKKKHFTPVFPQCEDIVLDDVDDFLNHYVTDFLQNQYHNHKVWTNIEESIIIKNPNKDDIFDRLVDHGANQIDYILAMDLVEFVENKGVCGATCDELKSNFSEGSNLELHVILKVLIDNFVLFQGGICTIAFVHNKFQSNWLIETFSLSMEEQLLLNKTNVEEFKVARDTIEKRLSSSTKNLLLVKVMPWTRVDGTVNEELLKRWLCLVLSHCLDVPKIPMTLLFDKFCYIKPVDIFYLVEVLKDLGCLEIFAYENTDNFLTTECELTKERYATFLDNFKDMYIEPTNVAMLSIGSFFHNKNR